MYKQIKNILFQLQPEEAHHFVTRNLQNYTAFPGVGKLLDKFYSNHWANHWGRLVCNKLLKIIYENARTVTCILCGKACHGCSF